MKKTLRFTMLFSVVALSSGLALAQNQINAGIQYNGGGQPQGQPMMVQGQGQMVAGIGAPQGQIVQQQAYVGEQGAMASSAGCVIGRNDNTRLVASGTGAIMAPNQSH